MYITNIFREWILILYIERFHNIGFESIDGVINIDTDRKMAVYAVTFGNGTSGELRVPYRFASGTGPVGFELAAPHSRCEVTVPKAGEPGIEGTDTEKIAYSSDVHPKDRLKQLIRDNPMAKQTIAADGNMAEFNFR